MQTNTVPHMLMALCALNEGEKKVKTIRTVQSLVERDESVDKSPEFKIGEYMEVYCGELEGHNFTIKDIRYNHDLRRFEYLYDGVLMGGWHGENTIIRA